MTRADSGYTIEGWQRGRCVWWARAVQSRAVLRHVTIALVDHGAERVHVTRYGPSGSREVAQVTNAGIWRWSGTTADHGTLRDYVETEH